MQVKRPMFWAIALISLFVLQSTSPLLHPVGVDSIKMDSQGGIEWVQFDLVDGVYSDAVGYSDFTSSVEERDRAHEWLLQDERAGYPGSSSFSPVQGQSPR